jgi:predicted nucleic acid-binding protein
MGRPFGFGRGKGPKRKILDMQLTLDSSVIVAALRKQEKKHKQSKTLLEKVKNGEHIAFEPYIVLVEVVAAIRRRTGSESLADRVKKDLQQINTLNFLELESRRANESANIAKVTGVKGMDAIVAQIAKEFDATLVSLDVEMIERLKTAIKTETVDQF